MEFNRDLLQLLQSLTGLDTNTDGADSTDGASQTNGGDNSGADETLGGASENFNFGDLGGLGDLGNIDFELIMKISSVFSKLGENDKNSALLQALRLHMRDENKHKIDGAIKITKMLSLVSILKEAGLLGKLF